jgi:mannose-1-phosphate guanylyltransferase/mannose-6-phosphate isomerase
MNKVQVFPTILCGGSGTRLWPLSRAEFPKQFLSLGDSNLSLFQESLIRASSIDSNRFEVSKNILITNEQHRFLALDQYRECSNSEASFILEPKGRNTAPALTLAALQAQEDHQDPVLVVMPADQTVQEIDRFSSALNLAIQTAADSSSIVTLGIQPTKPETGYGYIHAEFEDGDAPRAVQAFVEKPDIATAQHYIDSGDYFWNAGIFVLRASTWLDAIKHHAPDIFEASKIAFSGSTQDPQSSNKGQAICFVRPNKDLFSAIRSESIDYAVIEPLSKAPKSPHTLKMIPLNAGWNDLGSWNAVWEADHKDNLGNVSKGDTNILNAKNCLVHSAYRMVGVAGVEDLVVVETADAVLVTHRDQSQDVKTLVNHLSQQAREEHALHRKVCRPWGWYDSLDEGERFKVKRIQVKPGASLSLQKHHHRAEHWIVVKGTAEVTCGNQTITLTENQSTYIPLGEIHRLANPGTIPLEIIEVQSGSYLGEDDIVRFEDHYGRHQS